MPPSLAKGAEFSFPQVATRFQSDPQLPTAAPVHHRLEAGGATETAQLWRGFAAQIPENAGARVAVTQAESIEPAGAFRCGFV